MELFGIAIRNVLRNKRRSILNIIALSVGIWLMILGLGWVNGYNRYIFDALINFNTGDLQVLHPDYLDEEQRFPLDLTIDNYRTVREELLKDPLIEELTGRISFPLRVSNEDKSLWVMGRGIDPEPEAAVTVVENFVRDGQYLTGGNGILLGAPLAEKLGVGPGDTIKISAQDIYSAPNLLYVQVIGTFQFDYPSMDESMVFMNLQVAEELLGLDNQVTGLVLKLKQGVSHQRGQRQLSSSLGEEIGAVYEWKQFAQTTVSAVEADAEAFYVMLGILFILIFLGIVNSMSMSIQERTREIGTIRAIGMRKSGIIRLFLAEAVVLAVLAGIAAMVLCLPIAWYLENVGLNIGQTLGATMEIPFGDTFYADFALWHFVLSFSCGISAAFIGALKPSLRAGKIIVADALRGAH